MGRGMPPPERLGLGMPERVLGDGVFGGGEGLSFSTLGGVRICLKAEPFTAGVLLAATDPFDLETSLDEGRVCDFNPLSRVRFGMLFLVTSPWARASRV